MSLFPVFKVNKIINKGDIDVIYVFCGHLDIDADELKNLFDENPRDKIFSNIFDEVELGYIEKNNTEIVFVQDIIHIDDSIGIIKLKIFDAIQRKASMSEMYLYCLKKTAINPITMYHNLTQNDKLPLTKIRYIVIGLIAVFFKQ